jgi:hypothetical protein
VDGLLLLAGLTLTGIVGSLVILWVVPLVLVVALAVSGGEA